MHGNFKQPHLDWFTRMAESSCEWTWIAKLNRLLHGLTLYTDQMWSNFTRLRNKWPCHGGPLVPVAMWHDNRVEHASFQFYQNCIDSHRYTIKIKHLCSSFYSWQLHLDFTMNETQRMIRHFARPWKIDWSYAIQLSLLVTSDSGVGLFHVNPISSRTMVPSKHKG